MIGLLWLLVLFIGQMTTVKATYPEYFEVYFSGLFGFTLLMVIYYARASWRKKREVKVTRFSSQTATLNNFSRKFAIMGKKSENLLYESPEYKKYEN